MNRYDYINQLDEALKGNVSEQERYESVGYYRTYIEEEMGKGRTEKTILDDLGSPYAIAKSIIEAKGMDFADDVVYDEYQESATDSTPTARMIHLDGWKSWFVIAGIILIVLLVISFVFKLFTAVLPFLIPFLIVLFILKLLFNRR